MSTASPSEMQFTPLADAGEVAGLLTRSHDAPVVVFKHSTTCPISTHAYREMERFRVSGDAATARGGIALVVVQQARAASQQVAAQTGVRHESPQAIVLRGGQAVWTASHYDITADAVAAALRDNS